MTQQDERLSRPSPPAKAAALAYDPMSDSAPRLVGKGTGPVAEKMISIAQERGIAIHKDPGLLGFLMRVDLEEKIPSELYTAVATVLAMVWTAELKINGAPKDPSP